MNNKGVALIFSFIIVLVLSILLSAFYFKSINENNMVRRYISSMRAFWAAEAGIAEAKSNLPNSPTNGNIGDCSYETTTTYRASINNSDYYDIASTGTAPSSGSEISRTLNAVVMTGPVDPSKFQYSVQAANDLCFGGNCKKDPYTYIHPCYPPGCDGHQCYKEFDNTINFADMFGYQLSEISSIATHYTNANFPGTVSGVTWVDVTPGGTLMVTGSQQGSGILVVNGNVHFGGTYQFRGVVYVLGTLTARGNFDLFGSAIVASTSDVDSINGTPDLTWDENEITSALQQLTFSNSDIVSWNESE
jgi:hypothetical protein